MSIEINTITDAIPAGGNARVSVGIGSRTYEVTQNGSTGLFYKYSDDDEATWSAAVQVIANTSYYPTIVADTINNRIEIFYAGGNNASAALKHRAITSNVLSGVPGALTAEINIDAAGANLGVSWISACITPTTTRPRLWVMGKKWTAAGVNELRLWYVNAGADADNAASYATMTNLTGTTTDSPAKHGIPLYHKVAGIDKITLLIANGNDQAIASYNFDPTAVTPALGGAPPVVMVLGEPFDDWNGTTPLFTAAARDDYVACGVRKPSDGKWYWFDSANGITWAAVGSFTAGRAQITYDSVQDFHVVNTTSFGAIATTVQPMERRKLTTATHTFGASTPFSDVSANPVFLPLVTGSAYLRAIFRASTASPYSLRSDKVSLAGAPAARQSMAMLGVG